MKIITLSDLPEEGVSHDPGIKKRVMLRNGDISHITNFSQATFAPGQTVTPHAHTDMVEVFFVESGHGTIWIDGEAHALAEGVCVTVETNETHELKNTGDTPMVLTYFGVKV